LCNLNRYTIEGAELIGKIFLESGLVVKDKIENVYALPLTGRAFSFSFERKLFRC